MAQLLPKAPKAAMQGQSLPVSWSSIEAELYILERSADGGEWHQVYGGVGLEYADTTGEWERVQYRVKGLTGGVGGEYETTGTVTVLPDAAVAITGTNEDLGEVAADLSYTVLTNTGKPIRVTQNCSDSDVRHLTLAHGEETLIPVLDLLTGTGTITIEAKVEAEDGEEAAVRTWTYTKPAPAFPNAGSTAQLTQDGKPVWPATLAEAVRTTRGKPLDQVLAGIMRPKTAEAFGLTYTPVSVDLSTAAEGDIVQLPEGGKPAEFYVAKLDYESDLNGAGRTLVVRKDAYETRAWHSSNVNAYATCTLDTWFNSTYKALLSADIQAAMGTTKFYYTPGNGNTTVSQLERAVFALSLTELGQSHTDANVEGTALSIADTLKIAYLNGAATTQWTRSPYTGSTAGAWLLSTDGGISSGICTSTLGARPAFTLPSDFSATWYVRGYDGAIVDEVPEDIVPDDALALLSRQLEWRLMASFKTAGSFEWTPPDDLFYAGEDTAEIGVYIVGGGGGGGAKRASGSYNQAYCAGGAAGYAKNVRLTVEKGKSYPVVVGVGGEGKSMGDAGGTSSFDGNTAAGGGGGKTETTIGNATCTKGGQPADGYPYQTPRTIYGGVLAVSYNTIPDLSSGPSPRESQNAFDPFMVTLCAGGGICGTVPQIINAMPDGTKGGDGYYSATATSGKGRTATGNGNGGGALYLGNTAATSYLGGNGSPGMVLIYRRNAS